jgi:plasmid stability protein
MLEMRRLVRHNESTVESFREASAVALKQLTIRGFDADLERRLRLEARRGGLSLNQAALRLLRRGAGLGAEPAAAHGVGNALDHLIGSWSEADANSLQAATAVFERADEEFWK